MKEQIWPLRSSALLSYLWVTHYFLYRTINPQGDMSIGDKHHPQKVKAILLTMLELMGNSTSCVRINFGCREQPEEPAAPLVYPLSVDPSTLVRNIPIRAGLIPALESPPDLDFGSFLPPMKVIPAPAHFHWSWLKPWFRFQ